MIVSDGITESMNSLQELFGEERMHRFLSGLRGCEAATVVDRLIGAVCSSVGEAPQWDDMTVVVVRRND